MTATIFEAIANARNVTDRGFTFLDGAQNESAYTFERLSEAAERRGRQLIARGYNKGDRIGLVIPDNEEFVLTFLGAVSAGIVPVPMYPPLALGKLDSYLQSAAGILRASEARAVVTSKKVSPILWSILDKVDTLEDLLVVDKLAATTPAPATPVDITPDDPCFLQFTSGSTSDPKGVVVTHGNLAANAKAIMYDGLHCDAETDKGVSWLPLYHDMGLIGFVIAPLLATVPIVFIQTLSFVKRPNLWMDVVNRYRGTITFAPNFAFALAAKRATRQVTKEGFDLSCLRVVGCGAEPINPTTIRKFVDAYAPAKLNEHAIMPCYGMAEATLAMSFEPLTEPLFTTTIDRDAYENEDKVKPANGGAALELVSCGRTFPGHAIGIMGPGDALVEDGKVGEIVFRGPSVTAGYFKNDAASQETIRDGWLHTGDLGFIVDGRVYVSGRMKDLIILNGRNYYPQSIEWEVEQITGVRKGNVVSFSIRADVTEKLVVVAESKTADKDALASTIKTAINSALGLKVDDVVVVPAGALPKTSSGKLQRRKTKSQYEDGTLGLEGIRTMGKNATRRTLARHITISFFARVRHRMRSIRWIPAPTFGRFGSRRIAPSRDTK